MTLMKLLQKQEKAPSFFSYLAHERFVAKREAGMAADAQFS
jgi:hypothetical protein